MKVTIKKTCDLSVSEIIERSPVANSPDAAETLRKAVYMSQEVWYGFYNGEFACAWGVIPPSLLSSVAYLWLITTDVVVEHKFVFIRHSQIQLKRVLELYPVIVGDVLVANDLAKTWLKWLGAEFEMPVGKRMPFKIKRKEG